MKESLWDFVQWLIQVVHEVPRVNHDLLEGIMHQNLHHQKFKESIIGKLPSALEKLQDRVEKYIWIEEAVETQYLGKRKIEEIKHDGNRNEDKQMAQRPHIQRIPLNACLTNILVIA